MNKALTFLIALLGFATISLGSMESGSLEECDKYDPYLLSIKSIDLVSSKKNLNYADLNDEGLSDLSVDLLTTFGVCAGLAIVFVLLGVLLLFISNRDAKNAPTEVED